MITVVPATRLLWLAAIAGIPLLSLAGSAPQYAWAAIFALLACVAWTLLDAKQSRATAAVIKISIPERINLFMGRPGEIEIHIINPDQSARAVRIGLNMPPEIIS